MKGRIIDCAFTKTSGEHSETIDDYGATLVIVDADTMFPRSIPCEAKGDCGYTAASVVKFINSFFHGKVRLRSDGEGPIVALANAVKKELSDRVKLEQTPLHSSASNPAERVIKDIEGQVRVMRIDLAARYGVVITADMPVWPWLTRHAGWLLAGFMPKASGRTAYMDAFDSNYNTEVVPFGETVLFRVLRPSHRGLPGGKRQHRADADWKRGIWRGRTEETNENVLITPEGRVRARRERFSGSSRTRGPTRTSWRVQSAPLGTRRTGSRAVDRSCPRRWLHRSARPRKELMPVPRSRSERNRRQPRRLLGKLMRPRGLLHRVLMLQTRRWALSGWAKSRCGSNPPRATRHTTGLAWEASARRDGVRPLG